MEIAGPIHVTGNTFSYDVGLYRCTLRLEQHGWSWEIAERLPAPLHAAEKVHISFKASGNAENAEDALAAMGAAARRLGRSEEGESQDKYAG